MAQRPVTRSDHYHLDHHQLTLILDVLGTPTMEDYYGIKSRRAREYIRSLPFKKKIPFRALFPKSNELALDLLEKLLAFNPAKRITVEDALRHPYLEPYHDPDDEPTAPPIPEGFFDFDKNKDALSKEQLKSMTTLHEHDSTSCLDTNVCCSPDLRRDYAVRQHRVDIAEGNAIFQTCRSFDRFTWNCFLSKEPRHLDSCNS